MDYIASTAHQDLGPDFFDEVEAAAFPRHVLRFRNGRAAAEVGLAALDDPQWIAHFGRFEPLPGSLKTPLALRYHGHQFQSYNPDLGDGRGFLFAQLREIGTGRLLDLATKGSGQTPWSRAGDGRLTLKGGMREILAAEMLEALGVDTSRAFSLVETGESLMRNDEPSPTRASVLVRLSHSHIRIGTFQRLAYLEDRDGLARLVDHCITHYFPDLADAPSRALALYEASVKAVARTGARWLAAGFVHGVLNTDNINITGESFDYGPWRFTPTFDVDFTAAYFDHTGLYAFGRQPTALAWNLARLGECLLPLADHARIEEIQAGFGAAFQAEFARALIGRLGLVPFGDARDDALVEALFAVLTQDKPPMEQVFFDWFNGEASAARAQASPSSALYESERFRAVRTAWREHAPRNEKALQHAYFQRTHPCTMLIEEVESLWSAIAERDDWQPLQAKLADIRAMAAAYELGR